MNSSAPFEEFKIPYITKERASQIALGEVQPPDLTPGDLNYLITSLVVLYVASHTKNYTTLNSVTGALDDAKDEFKRRLMNPYEVLKINDDNNIDPYAQLFEKPRIEIAQEIK